MTGSEISEEVLVGEAQVVASRLVEWFQQRMLTADNQRAEAEQHVIEVERLLVASEELAEQLQHALDTRIVIEQAKGFVAARYGVTPETALEAMRGYARQNRVALRDVAADALTGTPHLEL